MPDNRTRRPSKRAAKGSLDFLAGGMESGELARSVDWAKTAIGPVEGWSQALRSTASLVLHNHSGMLLWWGPDFVQIYNDALGLLAEGLADALKARQTDAHSALAARVASGIAVTNQNVRSIARGLVPVPVDAETLPAALAELARSTAEASLVSCRFYCAEHVRAESAIAATHLFRIAQEAVANALRHAQATAISLRLLQKNGELVLEIQDDGMGISVRNRVHMGIGLRLMEHRCAIVGGRFTIEQPEEGGTLIACVIPIENPSSSRQS